MTSFAKFKAWAYRLRGLGYLAALCGLLIGLMFVLDANTVRTEMEIACPITDTIVHDSLKDGKQTSVYIKCSPSVDLYVIRATGDALTAKVTSLALCDVKVSVLFGGTPTILQVHACRVRA